MRGLVRLEDLPEKMVYVRLSSDFLKKSKEMIVKRCVISLSKEIGAKSLIRHWLREGTLIRLDVLNKISAALNLSFKDNIIEIRGKKGFPILNPKLPFDFRTESGVKFIAAVFGDGCLDKRSNIFYSNTNPDLIEGFLKDSRNIFGDIKYSLWESKEQGNDIKTATLPPIAGKAFEALGFPKGRKVFTNPKIPDFIFSLNKDRIFQFIGQIIDDEGSISHHSRHISINQSVWSNYETSNLMDGIKKLLLKLGMDCSLRSSMYNTVRGKMAMWRLEIHSFDNLERLHKFSEMRHIKKKKCLEALIKSKQQSQFSKKKCREIYLDLMKKLETEKGFFTSFDISKATNRDVGTCRNTLVKLEKLGLIKEIGAYYGGNLHKPAKFVVSK